MRSKLAIPVIAVALAAGASAFTATRTFAADHGARRHHTRMHHHYRDYSGYGDDSGYRDYSGYLDPSSGHYDNQFQRNRENFGFSGRDPSRVGGVDPSLNPPGMGR
jgi:hypothetical protein